VVVDCSLYTCKFSLISVIMVTVVPLLPNDLRALVLHINLSSWLAYSTTGRTRWAGSQSDKRLDQVVSLFLRVTR